MSKKIVIRIKNLHEFVLETYLAKLEQKIVQKIDAMTNEDLICDLLLDDFIHENKNIFDVVKIIKHVQMATGDIWQKAIGCYRNFSDLGTGDLSGLDVISYERKIIMEIKNRNTTDNSSSRKTNFKKLANFKASHKDFECIYAVINDTNPTGSRKVISYDGVEIIYCSGKILLEYIFGNDTESVIKFIRKAMNDSITQKIIPLLQKNLIGIVAKQETSTPNTPRFSLKLKI